MNQTMKEESRDSSCRFYAPVVGPQRIELIDYTNYRGERSIRRVIVQAVSFKATEFHPEVQWILTAYDTDKQAVREFAIKDIHNWPIDIYANL